MLTIVVEFLQNASSAADHESNGLIGFTIILSTPFDAPFTVQVCARETTPRSAEGISLNYIYKITKLK